MSRFQNRDKSQFGTGTKSRIYSSEENFIHDLEGMKMTLDSVSALLNDAERRSIQEEAVRLWLRRLKNAMYSIDDMMDEIEAGTKPAASKVCF